MNRGICKIIISILIVMELGFVFLSFKAYSNKTVEEIKKVNNIVEKEQFSMYIEQEDGTYKREKQTNYLPATGYILNEEKTYCEDTKGVKVENAVSFNSGKLTMTSSKTIYCTLYMDKICTLADDTIVEAGLEGAKYNCKVDPNKPEYTFYLMDNNEDGTSDLIMNANINASGEAVIPGVTSDKGLIEWYADEMNNINGPVTAMTYLHNATKSWTNIEPLNYTYNDREVQGITTTDKGYQSFVSTNGIATITKGDSVGTQVTIGTLDEPLRARMPIYSTDAGITEVSPKTDAKSYLYENTSSSSPYGYWTLTSSAVYSPRSAWRVGNSGSMGYDHVDDALLFGVRPVITIKL